MTGYRRAWGARAAAVLGCATIVVPSTMSTASTAAEPPAAALMRSTTATQAADGLVAVGTIGTAQTLRVTIPEVMIGTPSRSPDGALDVPVLIAAGGVAGRAYVDPPAPGRSWRLVPGHVTWVHCASAARNQDRAVVVVLDDGRTIARRM